MNKYMIFGVVAFFALALVSAGLVTYLSNTSNADVKVSSPIYQLVSYDGNDWTEDAISFNIYGGETVSFSAKDTNMANVEIETVSENFVTNEDGVTCDDFVSVIVTTTTIIGDGEPEVSGPHDLIAYDFCSTIDANTVTFSYGPSPNTWEVGKEDTSDIAIKFKPNAVGTYKYQNTNLYPN